MPSTGKLRKFNLHVSRGDSQHFASRAESSGEFFLLFLPMSLRLPAGVLKATEEEGRSLSAHKSPPPPSIKAARHP